MGCDWAVLSKIPFELCCDKRDGRSGLFLKPSAMPLNILTTEDLREFKMELFEEIHQIFATEKNKKRSNNWVKSSQVMRILRISHGTLQSLRNNKIIPYYQVGGLIFYDLEEINKILLDSRTGNEVEDL